MSYKGKLQFKEQQSAHFGNFSASRKGSSIYNTQTVQQHTLQHAHNLQ